MLGTRCTFIEIQSAEEFVDLRKHRRFAVVSRSAFGELVYAEADRLR